MVLSIVQSVFLSAKKSIDEKRLKILLGKTILIKLHIVVIFYKTKTLNNLI